MILRTTHLPAVSFPRAWPFGAFLCVWLTTFGLTSLAIGKTTVSKVGKNETKPSKTTSAQKNKQPSARKSKKRKPAVQKVRTIVVTGGRRARNLKDTVTQTEVITRRQIERSSAQKLSEVLETHLGVQITTAEGLGANIQLQGLDSKYVLILVDGQRVNGRIRGGLDLDRFPLEQIERIEIVKGATSALYGSDAIGGVINIITRQNKKPFFANAFARYGYGDSHLMDVSGTTGGRWKGWSGQLSLAWSRYDGWDRDPKDAATTGSNDHQFTIAGQTAYRFSKKIQLFVRGDYQLRDRAGLDGNSVGAVFDRKNRTEVATGSVFLNALVGPMMRLRWKAGVNYFYDQFLYEQRNGATRGNVQKTYDLLAQSVLQLDVGIGENHFISIGLDGLFEHLETPRIEQNGRGRGRIAMFLQYEFMLYEPIRISVVPGLRIGYDTVYELAFNPKLSIRVDPIKDLAIRASYGWGFRAPDFKELFLQFENSAVGYAVVGNPNLRPESSASIQLGLEWSGLSWMSVQFNLFRNDLDQLINFQPLDGAPGSGLRYTYGNIDEAITQGAELQASFYYKKILQVVLGYTFMLTEDLSTKKPLLGRPLHRGNVQILLSIPGTGLRLYTRGTIAGTRDMADGVDPSGKVLNRVEVEPYFIWHAKAGYFFFQRKLEAFVSVNNILQAGDALWLPIRPRTVFAGLRWRYP